MLTQGFRPRATAPSNDFARRNKDVETRPVNLREGQVLDWLRQCFPASTALKHGMNRGGYDDSYEMRQTAEYRAALARPDLMVTFRDWEAKYGMAGARVVVEVITAKLGPHPFWNVTPTKKARLDAAQAELHQLDGSPSLFLACLTQDLTDDRVLLIPWPRFETFSRRGQLSFAEDVTGNRHGWIIPASATFGRRWNSLHDPHIFNRSYQPPLEVHKAALREQGAPKRTNAAPIQPNKLDELLRARTLIPQHKNKLDELLQTRALFRKSRS